MAIPNSVSEVTFMFSGYPGEIFNIDKFGAELNFGLVGGASASLSLALSEWEEHSFSCFYVEYHPGAKQEPEVNLFDIEALIKSSLESCGVSW